MMVSLEELTTLKEVGFDRVRGGLHMKTILGTNGVLYDDEIFVEFCDPFDLISAYFYYYFESGMDRGGCSCLNLSTVFVLFVTLQLLKQSF